MSFGDLPAENKTYARATGLRCEERNEQVCCIGKARAIIENPNIKQCALPGPANLNAAAILKRGIRAISHQIDQQLLQLIGIRRNDYLRTLLEADLDASLKLYGSADPLRYVLGQQLWLRQSSKLGVRGHETSERLRARTNDAQSLSEIIQDPSGRFSLQFR